MKCHSPVEVRDGGTLSSSELFERRFLKVIRMRNSTEITILTDNKKSIRAARIKCNNSPKSQHSTVSFNFFKTNIPLY